MDQIKAAQLRLVDKTQQQQKQQNWTETLNKIAETELKHKQNRNRIVTELNSNFELNSPATAPNLIDVVVNQIKCN